MCFFFTFLFSKEKQEMYEDEKPQWPKHLSSEVVNSFKREKALFKMTC